LFNHKKIYKSDVQLALLEDLGDKDLSDGIIRDQIVTAFLKAKDDIKT
jgi:nicotinate-nucleotide pyrophosphorylase